MQPSELEIQREVEALRDIRRRSTTQGGPGALIIDPDLPNPSSPTSPNAGYWTSTSTPNLTDGDSSSSSHEDGSGSDQGSATDDPFHLFWVPASLHPEIAPAEFRAFLKEHARTLPADGASVERSNSAASTASFSSLGRKKSMLSRQYKPSENDGIEEEKVTPLRRNRTSVYTNAGPQLTISDLQKLEELAEEASESDDPTKLRSVLRRSLSLNVAPSIIDKMDDVPDMGDDVDSPIIVPRPGQILRRTARTKIRKPGLPGDGGGHRFGQSTRRGAGARSNTAPPISEPRTSSDLSSNDHDSTESRVRARTFSNESVKDGVRSVIRPESYSEEIYDAYMREDGDDEETLSPIVVTSPPPLEIPISPPPEDIVPTPAIPTPQSLPVLQHPQPQRLLSPPSSQEPLPSSRTPSPEDGPASPPSADNALRARSPGQEPNSFLSTSPSPQRKEKDKKGLFGKWGGDKSGKKNGKDKERENRERVEKEKEKEKESGFFGSLFGAKKKQDDTTSQTLGHSASGRETAAALLGASKSSKSQSRSTSPAFPNTAGSYARYPIHVERAIYRLSHIKLANPRRPLYEQVLISNLMFWYLGVINKTQTAASPTTGQNQSGVVISPAEKEQKDREQREREERARVEQERAEKEREQQRMVEQKKESPRRGSLTKVPSAGSLAGGRRAAEMPVRGPQYEMQHRVMEQEYSGFSGQPSDQGYGPNPTAPMGRTSSAPVGGGGNKQHQQHPQSSTPANFYFGASGPSASGMEHQPQTSPRLPPGAMPPASVEQATWLSSPPQSPSSASRRHSPPSPPPNMSPNPRRSRSPPPPNNANQQRFNAVSTHEKHLQGMQGMRTPGRSLSATAVPPPNMPQQNGRTRKVTSAHAVVPNSNARRPKTSEGGEEEDVPLAVWQQQRRR